MAHLHRVQVHFAVFLARIPRVLSYTGSVAPDKTLSSVSHRFLTGRTLYRVFGGPKRSIYSISAARVVLIPASVCRVVPTNTLYDSLGGTGKVQIDKNA